MIGKTALGKYRLRRSLGRGSNGEVFLADCLHDPPRRVVVKRVHDHVTRNERFRQLFAAEVESMARFSHPYAVQFLEASIDDPLGPCLVMEYVAGITLERVLEIERVLDLGRVCRLTAYLCHALQAAHDSGIIHRDLKPSNLMVTDPGGPTESLKVMDFGFAGFVARPHIQLAELTGHGPIYAMGTPEYVSPEMIRGDPVDARSDLYSLGVIVYEMLAGRLPFDYREQDRLLKAHVRESPPRLAQVGAGMVPPAVEAVVLMALSKYPNERQQSAREFLDMLGQAVGEDLWEAARPVGWEPEPAFAEECDDPPPEVSGPSGGRDGDPYRVIYQFETFMPERLAAAKLRGFVEDVGGQVLASEPGLVRLRVGVPPGYKESDPTESGLLSWLRALRRPHVPRGEEPVELRLHLQKPEPNQARLAVLVELAPLRDYPPADPRRWHDRCERIYGVLRSYLGT